MQDHGRGVPEGGTVNRHGAVCIACNNGVPLSYVRGQARVGNMSEQMTAIVAEGDRRRVYVSPTNEHIKAAISAEPIWRPTQPIIRTPKVSALTYGSTHWHQLFTERQLTALTTFSDLIADVRQMVKQEGANDKYADVLCTYLALVGRIADSSCSYATWINGGEFIGHVFTRQAIPMVCDFAEVNIFSTST